jgi:XTP/dITP diphosphohydrolase
VARGECRGTILPAPRGSAGFGYDPVFRPEGCDVSMAELPAARKNRISHRGRALEALAPELARALGAAVRA